MSMSQRCEKCGRELDEFSFYRSRNPKHSTGYLPICKQCATEHINNWKPESYIWLLQEMDIPYVPQKWNQFLDFVIHRDIKIGPMSVIGRYVSYMNLYSWKSFRFADSEAISANWKG